MNHSCFAEISMEGKELMLSMLNKDPNQRPSCEQVINHIWFQQRISDVSMMPFIESADITE